MTCGNCILQHIARKRRHCSEGCISSDCGECACCRDMIKFGGSGEKKQSCIKRKCLGPGLNSKIGFITVVMDNCL